MKVKGITGKKYKLTPEEVKARKKYKKMIKSTKKALKQDIKCWGPWEYGTMLSFLYTCIDGMIKYYEIGYNVWAEENPATPEGSRLAILKECQRLIDKVIHCDYHEEAEGYAALFNYLGKHICWLWD